MISFPIPLSIPEKLLRKCPTNGISILMESESTQHWTVDEYILFTLRLYCRVKPWLQTGHQTLLFLTLPAAAGLELLLLSLCCCCMGLLAA